MVEWLTDLKGVVGNSLKGGPERNNHSNLIGQERD